MTSVSTLGLYLGAIEGFRAGQARLDEMQQQLASGRIADDLAALPAKAPRLLDLQGAIGRHDAYAEAIDRALPRARTMALVLQRLEGIAVEVGRAAMTAADDGAPDPGGFRARAEAALNEVESQLNQRVGAHYLFAGARPGVAPARGLATLPMPPTEPPPWQARAPGLPAYDAQAPGPSRGAWIPDQVRVDDGEIVRYGVTATDPGIQDLVMGLRRVLAATGDRANFSLHMDTARQLLDRAREGLRRAQNTVALGEARLVEAQDRHRAASALAQGQRDTLVHADPAEIGVRMGLQQVQLQASYASLARIRELTLASFVA